MMFSKHSTAAMFLAHFFLLRLGVMSKHWTSWDPAPLKPYFWLPSTLIKGFDITHSGEHPCSRVKSAIQLEGKYGRFNNYLIEMVHMLEIAILSDPPKALLLSPVDVNMTKGYVDFIAATKSFACVLRWDSPQAAKIPLKTKVFAKDIFFQPQHKFSSFRGQVLAQLFLSASPGIRSEVEALESKHGINRGFNAIHLRDLEGTCQYRSRWIFQKTQYMYAKELRRFINENDVCNMSFDYVQWRLKKAGTEYLPLFLAHDGQNLARVDEIMKECFTVRKTCIAQSHHITVVDFLLMLRANTFIPNIASSMSANVEHARNILHSVVSYEDELTPDLRDLGLPWEMTHKNTTTHKLHSHHPL